MISCHKKTLKILELQWKHLLQLIRWQWRVKLGVRKITIDYESLARKAVKEIGYEQEGFHWKNFFIAQEFTVLQILQWVSMHQETKIKGLAIKELCLGVKNPSDVAPIYYSHKILEEMAFKKKMEKQPVFNPIQKVR